MHFLVDRQQPTRTLEFTAFTVAAGVDVGVVLLGNESLADVSTWADEIRRQRRATAPLVLDRGGGLWRGILFGDVFIYWLSPGMLDYSRTVYRGFKPFYYSIVSFTTLGFGNVTPQTKLGQLLVTIEVVFGYLTLGLLISILANTPTLSSRPMRERIVRVLRIIAHKSYSVGR